MERLPKFEEERLLAERLKTPRAIETYEKLSLGAQIKKLRKKTGMKQAALAKKLGTSQSVIARIEAGKQNLTIRTLIAISALFGKRLHLRLM